MNFNFQKNQSKVQAKEMLHLAWKTLTASTDWKYEKSCSETGDVIASRQSEEGRKIFKLTVSLLSNENSFLMLKVFTLFPFKYSICTMCNNKLVKN